MTVAVRLVTAAIAAVLVAGCGPSSLPGSGTPSVGTAGEAVGIVTSIRGASPAEVSSFTLRTSSGEVLTFQVGRVQLAADSFPAGHLHEHLATAQPVRVAYLEQGGLLVATRLRDGP
jgi:hypothetical protein